jgi:hypothetical protein
MKAVKHGIYLYTFVQWNRQCPIGTVVWSTTEDSIAALTACIMQDPNSDKAQVPRHPTIHESWDHEKDPNAA